MAKDPAVLVYIQDFLIGTSFMNEAEVGQYFRILLQQADKGHLSLEDMQSICRDGVIFQKVKRKFIQDENGLFYNERMDIEVEKRKAFSESRRLNAIKNKDVPKKENQKNKKNTSKAYALHMEDINIIENIIKDLNKKTNSNYRTTTESYVESITARLKEGYTEKDFYTVHDNMIKKWTGTDMEQYLTPDTLYRPSKFPKYLNMKFHEGKQLVKSDPRYTCWKCNKSHLDCQCPEFESIEQHKTFKKEVVANETQKTE